MDAGVIAVRYARALLKSATELKVEDQVYRDMLSLYECYSTMPDLRTAVSNPMLQKDTKESLLCTAMGQEPQPLSKTFVALVLKEDRESMFQFMAASYATLYRKQKNIIRGKLTTAVAVSGDTEAKMKAMVERQTQGTVEFKTVVDPALIGGFILEYDTYRLDASVKHQLQSILSELKK